MREEKIDLSCIVGAGVYLLLWKEEVVYVGKSEALWRRLYSHRQNWYRRMRGDPAATWAPKGILFDGVLAIPCEKAKLDEVERRQIAIYNPKFNKKLRRKSEHIEEPVELRLGALSVTLCPRQTITRRV